MQQPTRESVFETLEKSRANCLGFRKINEDFSAAIWTNSQDWVSYHADQVHTLSFYTRGGEGSKRIDVNKGNGSENSICLIPQGQNSDWQISAPFEFIHLYFSDASLKSFASETLNKESRLVDVPDLTFVPDEKLVALSRLAFGSVNQLKNESPLFMEQAAQLIFAHLFSNKVYGLTGNTRVSGGLSPYSLNRVKEFIAERFNQKITITELAGIANVSKYHFIRMFKESCGLTPHEYLTRERIERAKKELQEQEPIASVAIKCGFSSQAHFSRTFKNLTGVTPGRYSRRTP